MADFYAARSRIIPPLPWTSFAPPFSPAADGGWKSRVQTARVGTTSIDLQTRFWPLGALMEKFALAPQFHKTIKGAQREFKAYVEGSAEVPKTAPTQHPRAVA